MHAYLIDVNVSNINSLQHYYNRERKMVEAEVFVSQKMRSQFHSDDQGAFISKNYVQQLSRFNRTKQSTLVVTTFQIYLFSGEVLER